MGRVFTQTEIEQNKIPKLESFITMAQRIRAGLTSELSIHTAVLCGSVVRGDHTIRSDIDCLVIYSLAGHRQAFAEMHRLSGAAKELHIPLSFIPCDSEVIKTHMHHLGPSFMRHVEVSAANGGLVKGFVDVPESIPKREEIESYLRVKLYKLEAGYAEYPALREKQKAALLQKMLEAPLHVSRKVLDWNGNLDGDSKQNVLDSFSSYMPEHISEDLARLLLLDQNYTAEVRAHVGQYATARYLSALSSIEEKLPDILDFVRSIVLLVAAAR